MVCRFVEDEEIGLREKRTAKRDAALFAPAERAGDAVRIGSVEMGDEAFRAVLDVPAVGMLDAAEQLPAMAGIGGYVFVFLDHIQDVPCAFQDVLVHSFLVRQIEYLREIAGDQITPADDLAAVRLRGASGDFEKS